VERRAVPRGAPGLRHGDPTDPVVCHLQPSPTRDVLEQDVGRLEIPMDDRRVEAVCGRHDPANHQDDRRDLLGRGRFLPGVPFGDEAGQVAPLDQFVLQARRAGIQIRLSSATIPVPFASRITR
jgi:hypothetical protein